MTVRAIAIAALMMVGALEPAASQAQPISIAEQGSFFVGGARGTIQHPTADLRRPTDDAYLDLDFTLSNYSGALGGVSNA